MNIEDIKIDIKLTHDNKLKAMVTLDFGDFKIKGFKIMISRYENKRGEQLWVVPPSFFGKDKRYHPIFFMEDKDLWSELENKILQFFQKTYSIKLNS